MSVIANLIKIVLLILELSKASVSAKQRKDFKKNVEAIKANPVDSWAKQFGRVQPNAGDQRAKTTDRELPTDTAQPTASVDGNQHSNA